MLMTAETLTPGIFTLALSQGWAIGGTLAFLAASIVLILTVLIQRPQGGGLSGAFGAGSGSGQTAFGAKTGDALTWATVLMFVLWLLIAVGLVFAARPQTLPAGTTAAGTPGAATDTTPADPNAPAVTPFDPNAVGPAAPPAGADTGAEEGEEEGERRFLTPTRIDSPLADPAEDSTEEGGAEGGEDSGAADDGGEAAEDGSEDSSEDGSGG